MEDKKTKIVRETGKYFLAAASLYGGQILFGIINYGIGCLPFWLFLCTALSISLIFWVLLCKAVEVYKRSQKKESAIEKIKRQKRERAENGLVIFGVIWVICYICLWALGYSHIADLNLDNVHTECGVSDVWKMVAIAASIMIVVLCYRFEKFYHAFVAVVIGLRLNFVICIYRVDSAEASTDYNILLDAMILWFVFSALIYVCIRKFNEKSEEKLKTSTENNIENFEEGTISLEKEPNPVVNFMSDFFKILRPIFFVLGLYLIIYIIIKIC